MSVGSSDSNVIGTCLTCPRSCDDYSSRCQCTYCRMLVLVCSNCQGAAMAALISAQQQKLKGEMDFKFVVLCSGFALRMKEMECGPIKCPSLHIFGACKRFLLQGILKV
ncbi:hypothetical protein VNO78_20524 [Psophocarpus tetragonolobus]|uniref:Serine hydrolase domain-containing protein n=1 Tax=Psophocarpus tetragonolobus TaxID=3891 RepID=A0AAN9SER6_PSOTE